MPDDLAALVGRDEDRDVDIVAVRTVIASLADKAVDAYDAYLRLHLLSHRLVAPHGLNADGLFGVLTNVVWTNHGPCSIDGFEGVRARLRRGARSPSTGSTSSRGWSTTSFPPVYGSPTRTGFGWARTSPRAPR